MGIQEMGLIVAGVIVLAVVVWAANKVGKHTPKL